MGPPRLGSRPWQLRVRTVRDIAEYGAALAAIGHYFGWAPTEDSTRFAKVLPFERMHAVLDDGRIVAGARAFSVPA